MEDEDDLPRYVEPLDEYEDDDPDEEGEGGAVKGYGPFTDKAQAVQHIYGRTVIYGNRAVAITQVGSAPLKGAAKVSVRTYNEAPEFVTTLSIEDPLFNKFRFDPLGWVNHAAGAIFAELLPIRQTKRGYGEENVKLWGFTDGRHGNRGYGLNAPENTNYVDLMYSDGFKEMLRGEYPSVSDVYVELKGSIKRAIALSRRFLMETDEEGYVWLWRDADKIGMMLDSDIVQLSKRAFYFREEMQAVACFKGMEIL